MLRIFALLSFILFSTLANAADNFPELSKRMDSFFAPLKAEYAHLSFDQAWKILEVSGSAGEAKELKDLLKDKGPIRKSEIIASRDGAGARLVRLTYRLKFKSGDTATMEVSFMKQLDSPYRIYEVKVAR